MCVLIDVIAVMKSTLKIAFIVTVFNLLLEYSLRGIADIQTIPLLPLALFFGAAIISTIISPDKRISLGVLKAWFFDPLLVLILFLDLDCSFEVTSVTPASSKIVLTEEPATIPRAGLGIKETTEETSEEPAESGSDKSDENGEDFWEE